MLTPLGVDFDAIEKSHLQQLVDNEVPENGHLEFKREIPLSTKDQKREFLADVCAFANATGGLILIGIEEQGSKASEVLGVQTDDPEDELLRYQNLLRDGLEPNLSDVRLRHILLDSGNYVFAIQILPSWLMPHRIKFSKDGRFLRRKGAQKYEPELSELRSMFLGSGLITERILEFRDERIEVICRGETPTEIPQHPSVIVHLVPLNFLEPTNTIDLHFAHSQNGAELMTPLGGHGGFTLFNLDGVISPYPGPQQSETNNYCQLFRNGIIESVSTSLIHRESKEIPSVILETRVIKATQRYVTLLRSIGAFIPVLFMLSLVGVKGFKLDVDQQTLLNSDPLIRRAFDRQIIPVPAEVITSYDIDVPRLLRPVFDTIWNASGWEGCTHYNAKGDYGHNLD